MKYVLADQLSSEAVVLNGRIKGLGTLCSRWGLKKELEGDEGWATNKGLLEDKYASAKFFISLRAAVRCVEEKQGQAHIDEAKELLKPKGKQQVCPLPEATQKKLQGCIATRGGAGGRSGFGTKSAANATRTSSVDKSCGCGAIRRDSSDFNMVRPRPDRGAAPKRSVVC